MTDLETILSWFQTGDLPTQEEFQETFSSFRHKNTKIPIAEVDGLESSLNNKLNVGDIIGGGAEFIQLTGTEPNKPLNGDIQINQANYETRFYAEQNGYSSELYFQGAQRASLKSTSPAGDFNSGSNTKIESFLGGATIQWNNGDFTSESKVTVDNNGVYLRAENPEANRYLNVGSTGIYTNAIIDGTNIEDGAGNNTFTRQLYLNSTGQLGWKSGGSISVVNAKDDPTFTRQLVQKDDGTIGYVDSEVPTRINFIINTPDVTGTAFYIKKGEVITAYIDISGTIGRGSAVQLLGETLKSTNRKIDLMAYADNGVDVIGLTGEALIVATQDNYPGIYIKNISSTSIDFIIKETFNFVISGNAPL